MVIFYMVILFTYSDTIQFPGASKNPEPDAVADPVFPNEKKRSFNSSSQHTSKKYLCYVCCVTKEFGWEDVRESGEQHTMTT